VQIGYYFSRSFPLHPSFEIYSTRQVEIEAFVEIFEYDKERVSNVRREESNRDSRIHRCIIRNA